MRTALELLSESLTNIAFILGVLAECGSTVNDHLVQLVAEADSRAECVCGLARRVLQLLRTDEATGQRNPQGVLPACMRYATVHCNAPALTP